MISILPNRLRDYFFGIKRFNSQKRIFPKEKTVIFFTEKGKWHGGFADRMKGIVSLFHYCLCKNIPFKIHYTFPFELSDFLQPNEYDWQIDKKQISFNRKEATFMFLYGKNKIKRLLHEKSNKQIHAFFNTDIVAQLNAEFHTGYTWGELFKKLFKPTEELQKLIDICKAQMNGKYISVVFRFQNMLGDFQEYRFQPLDDEQKYRLIDKCNNALIELQKKEKFQKILVTSDSITFLKSIEKNENIFVFPEKNVHIDTVSNEANSIYIKSFLDFYMIAEGEKVFCLGTKEMYPSEFPMYAAKINNIPFERILIE
jgi:hypothetical protein